MIVLGISFTIPIGKMAGEVACAYIETGLWFALEEVTSI